MSAEMQTVAVRTAFSPARNTKPSTRGKKRASMACRNCRRRKVRCDVQSKGTPCTNCRLDDIGCVLCERKGLAALRRDSSTDSKSNMTELEVLKKGHASESSMPTAKALNISALEQDTPFCAWATSPAERSGARLLPPYLHSDFQKISPADAAYLRSKGCFDLPEEAALDDLLKCYFEYVHPHVPFIDEENVWGIYLAGRYEQANSFVTTSKTISLILFRAIIFAASIFAPINVLQQAGFKSRNVAKTEMFSRVRVLYSLDVERDRIVLLQSFLLLSYWRDESGTLSDKDGWHWSSMAVDLANDLGIGREDQHTLDQRQRTFHKRLWWSCVVRDRLLALSCQRCPRTCLDDPAMPPLTLADYNLGLRTTMHDLTPSEEVGKRTALAMFSIQLMRLLPCVGRRVDRASIDATRPNDPWARKKRSDVQSIAGFDDLDEWRENLPELLRCQQDRFADDAVLPSIFVHRLILQFYYHRTTISRMDQEPAVPQPFVTPELLAQVAKHSIAHMVRLYEEAADRDLAHYLPRECFRFSSHQHSLIGVSGGKVALSGSVANTQPADLLQAMLATTSSGGGSPSILERPEYGVSEGSLEQFEKAYASQMLDLQDFSIDDEPSQSYPDVSAGGSSGSASMVVATASDLLELDALFFTQEQGNELLK